MGFMEPEHSTVLNMAQHDSTLASVVSISNEKKIQPTSAGATVMKLINLR